MAEQDTHGVREMSLAALQTLAYGQGPDLGKCGAARVELERRRHEREEEREEDQRSFERHQEVNRRKFEERLVKDQIEAAEKIAVVQVKIARSSFWATVFATGAAVALAVTAGVQLYVLLTQ